MHPVDPVRNGDAGPRSDFGEDRRRSQVWFPLWPGITFLVRRSHCCLVLRAWWFIIIFPVCRRLRRSEQYFRESYFWRPRRSAKNSSQSSASSGRVLSLFRVASSRWYQQILRIGSNTVDLPLPVLIF